MPLAALSNRGNESSREGELEETIEQYHGCIQGEIFLFVNPKSTVFASFMNKLVA